MGKESWNLMMDGNIEVTGWMIKWMERANLYGPLVKAIKETMKKIWKMGSAKWNIRMDQLMKDIGEKENSMVKVL